MKQRVNPRAFLKLKPCAPISSLENSRKKMRDTVVVRNVQSSERVCDKTGQGAGAGKNDSDAIAGGVCQKMQALLRDCLGLLRCVRADQKRSIYGTNGCTSHFFFAEQAVGNSIHRQRYRLRFAKRFFPRADPPFVNVTCFIARIIQQNGRFFRGNDGRLEQRPERPVRAIKSSHQNIGKRAGSRGPD